MKQSNGKPLIETVNGRKQVILHDIMRYRNLQKYNGTTFCEKHDVYEKDCRLNFTKDELRRATFSLNKGTAGPYLRILLDNKDSSGKKEYFFVAEKFEDSQDLVGGKLNFID